MQQRGDVSSGGRQEIRLAVIRTLASYVDEELGHDRLIDLAASCRLPADDLRAGRGWASQDQIESFATQVLRALGDDEGAFIEAASGRINAPYGPLRFLLWASSPGIVLKQAMRHLRLVASFGEYQIHQDSSISLDVSYLSSRSESRVLCLLRQAHARVLPRLWDLPPAQVTELSCIARGDEACRYQARWNASWRWGPLLVGATLGGLAAAALGGPLWSVAAVLMGGGLAYLGELRRSNRINLRFAEEARQAVEQLAHEEAQARMELAALHAREKEWSAMLEQQLADRSAILQDTMRELQKMQTRRIEQIRDYSHDLKNPLTSLSSAIDVIEDCPDLLDPEIRWIIPLQRNAADKIQNMIDQILAIMQTQNRDLPLRLTRMEVHPHIDGLRRRVQALVRGRDICVSVMHTRDMPESIQTDLMVFERIVDNILTNAAKYTQQGSILVELGGSPGFLVVKVLDTGQGISQEKIERIFKPEGARPEERSDKSWGVGLSVVVSLLDQLGGRLEVLSKPQVGTTFWLYIPVAPELAEHPSQAPQTPEMTPRLSGDADDQLARVVHIRRLG